MAGMLKQAMEMKQKMEALKEQLAEETIEAGAGGMVKVVFNGRMELLELTIDPEVVDKEDKDQLEFLVRTAVNDGLRKTQQMMKDRMQEITGGLDIPGLT
jgi:DNA-binding YbaB/EbfC family protein